jgi:paraquat-inducible protein B
MGKKASPTLIGLFVLGAVALAVLGVVVFGSGQFFKHLEHYVMYFPGSVNGLSVGAPVKFKGVDIGRVSDIRLILERDPGSTEKLTIPVYVETDPSKITFEGKRLEMQNPENLKRLIQEGLRAQLQSQSLVTGLLFVQIDMFPDTPIAYVMPQPSDPMEIPTVPSTLEQASSAAREIIDELRSIKVGPMIEQATQALTSINQLVSSPAVKTTVDELPATVKDLRTTVASMQHLADDLRAAINPLVKRVDATLGDADQALGSVRQTADAARVLIVPGSPLDYDLRSTLRDVSDAARAMAQLADFLERNPTALLYGKQTAPTEKP